MMSAFTFWLVFVGVSLSIGSFDSTLREILTVMKDGSGCFADYTESVPTLTCSQCMSNVDVLKNETLFLKERVDITDFICDSVCVSVDKRMRELLNFLIYHNSSLICEYLDYC